jgi:hypothetical protein
VRHDISAGKEDGMNSADRPEQTIRWQQPKTKRTGRVLRALNRMLDVDYGMLATWFSMANRNPQLHEDIKAVLVDHGYDVIETTLEDRGKPRFVEAADDSAEASGDGSREGHAWYVDEDEQAWGLWSDPSVPCNSVSISARASWRSSRSDAFSGSSKKRRNSVNCLLSLS